MTSSILFYIPLGSIELSHFEESTRIVPQWVTHDRLTTTMFTEAGAEDFLHGVKELQALNWFRVWGLGFRV